MSDVSAVSGKSFDESWYVALDLGSTSTFVATARDLLCVAYARSGRKNETDDIAAANLVRAAMTLLDLEMRLREHGARRNGKAGGSNV